MGLERVLHIAGWHGNVWGPHETPFIRRHIEALAPHCTNDTWHIEVRAGKQFRFTRSSTTADRTFLFESRLKRWLVLEWVATLLILWAWVTRDRSARYDLVNFHIAYPNCAHLRLLRSFIRVPMVITEHWSAYHSRFHGTTKGMHRIKRIFHSGIPVIVVSTALANDIAGFAGPPEPKFHVVDNAVDPKQFHPDPAVRIKEGVFFTIAGWRNPKRPDVLLEALAAMRSQGLPIRLRMAGDGPKMDQIKEQIRRLRLEGSIDLLGQLDPADVAKEIRSAHALVHASDYETYSAVCAEALCCGTPVIASQVGGIPEFLDPQSGSLVPTNSVEDWIDHWKAAWTPTLIADRMAISERMTARANSTSVGERYAHILRIYAGGGDH